MVSPLESQGVMGQLSEDCLSLQNAELSKKHAELLEELALIQEHASLAQENARLASENALLKLDSAVNAAINPYGGLLPMPPCALVGLPPFAPISGMSCFMPHCDPMSVAFGVGGNRFSKASTSLRSTPSNSRRSSFSSRSSTASTSTVSNCSVDSATKLNYDGPKTTIMMRNIPEDLTREQLLELVNAAGFRDFYDIVSLPIDLKREAALGYAFINFHTQAQAEQFKEHFNDFKDWPTLCKKVCEVLWSDNLQGYEAHIDRYRNSPVMHESVPDKFKPALYRNGIRAPFPEPTKTIKAPRPRTRTRGYLVGTTAKGEGKIAGDKDEQDL